MVRRQECGCTGLEPRREQAKRDNKSAHKTGAPLAVSYLLPFVGGALPAPSPPHLMWRCCFKWHRK